MRINKIYLKQGKIKLEKVKMFYKNGKTNIIIDNNRLDSSKNDMIYIYIEKGYLSWKSNNEEGLNEVSLEDIKANGRAINTNI